MTLVISLTMFLLAAMPAAAQEVAETAQKAEGLSLGMLLLGLAGLAIVGGILITREREGNVG